MPDILIVKDSSTLIPRLGISPAERITWMESFAIYDLNADGSKSGPYGPTAAAAADPSAPIMIDGLAVPGEVLSVVVSDGWIDSGGNWTQDGSNISGATGSKIYLTGSHSGKDVTYVPGGIPFAPAAVRVASPGLLATATKVAAMGDSIVERAFDPSAWPWSSGSEVSSSSKAAITWAKRLDPRFQWFAFYSAGANRARGGPRVKFSNPRFVVATNPSTL